MVMMFPVPIIGAVIPPNHDRGSAIHHGRRGYHHGRACRDHGRWVDDGWRWGSDHHGRRGDDHRKTDPNRYPNPRLCRGRQGKDCYA
jgi:hypothetical protein